MKLRVKVIQVSLAKNKVGNKGQVIDHTQLPVPENWPTLIEKGYLEHTKDSLKELDKAEKEAAKKAKADAEAQDKADKKAKADAEAKKAKKKAKKAAKKAKKKAKKIESIEDLKDESDNKVDLDSKTDDVLKQLSEMNKVDLVAYAEENGIEINKRDKKNEIFDVIVSSFKSVDLESEEEE